MPLINAPTELNAGDKVRPIFDRVKQLVGFVPRPTQMIGTRLAASTRAALRPTPWSVSPKYRRRSEWPRITIDTPRSWSIGTDTSTVNAP